MGLNVTPTGAMLLCGLAVVSQIAVGQVPMAVKSQKAWATPSASGQKVAAAYISLHNMGKTPEILTGASSSAAADVQIHRSELVNGVARMRRVERLAVPAHGDLKLAPRGNHLMLLGLKRPLVAGDEITVRLKFASGAILDVAVPVVAAPATKMSKGNTHAHH
jgi:copper(I)-binding protein